MKNGFTRTKKSRSTRYLAEAMTDADYITDTVLLANTLVKAESLLHSLEQAVGGIILHVNANKAEFICFKQEGTISSLSDKLLKLVD